MKLLQRTTRSVEPTAEGALLCEAAEQAVSDLREALRHFSAVSEGERNRVVVAATPMLSATVLPRLIYAYTERYPDLEIVLRDLPYERVIRSVVEGQADIGVTALDGMPRGLRFQSLAEENMLLVVPARHPLAGSSTVTLDQVVPHRLMFLDRYETLRKQLADEFRKRDADFNPATVATLPTLLGVIDAGQCITFLPRSMAQNNARRTRATLTVTDLEASRRYGSVVQQKAELSAAVQAFRAFLRQNFRTELEQLD